MAFLRSEFVLTGSLLLAASELLWHLDTAILLPLLALMALLLHMLLYGVLVTIVQCGEWGANGLRTEPHSHHYLRMALRWWTPRALGLLLWKRAGAIAGRWGLLLCHLRVSEFALLPADGVCASYAHQQYWIWPLCLLLGLAGGLWGRWLMTVLGYFSPTGSLVAERWPGVGNELARAPRLCLFDPGQSVC